MTEEKGDLTVDVPDPASPAVDEWGSEQTTPIYQYPSDSDEEVGDLPVKPCWKPMNCTLHV